MSAIHLCEDELQVHLIFLVNGFTEERPRLRKSHVSVVQNACFH